jgi:thioredoxin-like negative regulator of GroEL
MAEPVKDVTTAEWASAVLGSSKPVAADFWLEACVWCKRLAPEFEAVGARHRQRPSDRRAHRGDE